MTGPAAATTGTTLVLDLSLAARVGLPAACVHAFLSDWLSPDTETLVPLSRLEQVLPLGAGDALDALSLLQGEGLLLLGPGGGGQVPLTLRAGSNAAETGTGTGGRAVAQPMTLDWQPSEDTVRLFEEHQVPEPFWRSQLDGFRLYHRERGQPGFWEYRFFSWVRNGWAREPGPEQHALHWRPEPECLDQTAAFGAG